MNTLIRIFIEIITNSFAIIEATFNSCAKFGIIAFEILSICLYINFYYKTNYKKKKKKKNPYYQPAKIIKSINIKKAHYEFELKMRIITFLYPILRSSLS